MSESINFKDIDFRGIKEGLIEFLRGTEAFKDANFEGTFLSQLVHMLAYTGAVFGNYVNASASEQYITTCNLYETGNMLGSLVGYKAGGFRSSTVGVKLIPNFDKMNVTWEDINEWSAIIPRNAKFTTRGSKMTNKSLVFSNLKDKVITIKDPSLSLSINDIYLELIQGIPLSIEFESNGEPLQKFEIPNFQIDYKNIRVFIQGDGDNEELWESVTTWFYNYGNDKVYVPYINPKGLLEILFAEGNFGAIPSAGRKIRVEYFASQGQYGDIDEYQISSLSNKIYFINPEDPLHKIEGKFEVIQEHASTQGDNIETLSRIKKFAPLLYGVQERLVNSFDYKFYLLSNYTYLVDVEAFNYEEASTIGLLKSICENELLNERFSSYFLDEDVGLGKVVKVPNDWSLEGFTQSFVIENTDTDILPINDALPDVLPVELLNAGTSSALFVDTTQLCESDEKGRISQRRRVLFDKPTCNLIRFEVEVINPLKDEEGNFADVLPTDITLKINDVPCFTRLNYFNYSTEGYVDNECDCMRSGNIGRKDVSIVNENQNVDVTIAASSWYLFTGVYMVSNYTLNNEDLGNDFIFTVEVDTNRTLVVGKITAYPVKCLDTNDVFIVPVPNTAGYLNIATKEQILEDIDRIDMINVRNHILSPIYQPFDVRVTFKKNETSIRTLEAIGNDVRAVVTDYFSPVNQKLGSKINAVDISRIVDDIDGVERNRVLVLPKNTNMKQRMNDLGDFSLTEAEFPILANVFI